MNETQIAEYLFANPEFFERHAKLLATVQLKNPYGTGVISLQTRQMTLLRAKNHQLERRIATLLRYGQENDAMADKLTQLTGRLLAERDPYSAPHTLLTGLREIFGLCHVTLRLWNIVEEVENLSGNCSERVSGKEDGAQEPEHIQICEDSEHRPTQHGARAVNLRTGSESAALASFTTNIHPNLRQYADQLLKPICGATTDIEATQWLVESHSGGESGRIAADELRSAALIAVRHATHNTHNTNAEAAETPPAFGLILIGSSDPNRFNAEMATDFLARIGMLASAALGHLLRTSAATPPLSIEQTSP